LTQSWGSSGVLEGDANEPGEMAAEVALVPRPRAGRDLSLRGVAPPRWNCLARLTRRAATSPCVGNSVGARNVRARGKGPRWTTRARSRTVAALLDATEGGPELRQLRSGGQVPTCLQPALAERLRFVGRRLEPSLTLRKAGKRNRSSFQLQEGHPVQRAGLTLRLLVCRLGVV
jgi:hypothetical protein